METKKEIKKNWFSRNWVFLVLVIIFFILFIISIVWFMFKPPFNTGNTPNPTLFAQYGDFIGGLFGSLLTGATILILIYYNNKQLDLIKSENTKAESRHKDQNIKLEAELKNNQNQFKLSNLKQDYFYFTKELRDYLNKYDQPFYLTKHIHERVGLGGVAVRTGESAQNQIYTFLEKELHYKEFIKLDKDKTLIMLQELSMRFSNDHKHFWHSFIKKVENIKEILEDIKKLDDKNNYSKQFANYFLPEELLFMYIMGEISEKTRYQDFIKNFLIKEDVKNELSYYYQNPNILFFLNLSPK